MSSRAVCTKKGQKRRISAPRSLAAVAHALAMAHRRHDAIALSHRCQPPLLRVSRDGQC